MTIVMVDDVDVAGGGWWFLFLCAAACGSEVVDGGKGL